MSKPTKVMKDKTIIKIFLGDNNSFLLKGFLFKKKKEKKIYKQYLENGDLFGCGKLIFL